MAVDAMGGDHGVATVVEGAALACKRGFGPVTLVGDEALVRPELVRRGADPLTCAVLHAPDVIGMDEAPARVARARTESSIHVGLARVREGGAGGFFSVGNSGAVLAASIVVLRRLSGCERPAIAATMPSLRGPIVLLDAGANTECRALHLEQFARMGVALAQVHLGRARPTIGLLANGTEPGKGTAVLREAHEHLSASTLDFAGFIEGRDVPRGLVDVVVTDGFTGNVVLKLSEGISLALLDKARATLGDSVLGVLGGLLVRGSLRSLRRELHWAGIGGAPLLGVNGVVVVGHGASTPEAIANGIALTRTLGRENLVAHLRAALG